MTNILELERYYTNVDGKDIVLPNSVWLDEGRVVISDSGNNRLCAVGDGVEYSIGRGFGSGEYKFKEPVYAMSVKGLSFVCDWHNHRVVIFENRRFKSQIGVFGVLHSSRIKNFLRLIRSLKSNGSFDSSHFGRNSVEEKSNSSISQLKNIIQGIIYYLCNPQTIIKNISERIFINKPNGAVLIDDLLFFTQKDNRCVTCFDISLNKVINQVGNTTPDVDFGRLGQISYFNGLLYVCDETNNKVWIFDKGLNLKNCVSITDYNIFSISFNDDFIATCGVDSFSLFDHQYNKVFQSVGEGEYHGVCLSEDKLYVVNRLKHRIERFKINRLSGCNGL